MIIVNNPRTIGYANPFAGSNNTKAMVQKVQDVSKKTAQYEVFNKKAQPEMIKEVVANGAKTAYRQIKSAGSIIDFKA